MNAIEVRNLTKTYRGHAALDGLNLSLRSGQIVGLMGDNGSGKTTLLKILAGVLADWDGEVKVAGYAPGPESKALVSFLPDTSFLNDGDTCTQAIAQYRRFFADFDPEKAREMITFFGLPTDKTLKEMSKGMREKVQIALAMSRDAKVFLLDEPISGIDPAAREVILEAIVRDLSPDALVIISTHLIHDLEPILDGVAFMRFGKVLLAGAVDDLRMQHGKSIDELFREVYRWSPR